MLKSRFSFIQFNYKHQHPSDWESTMILNNSKTWQTTVMYVPYLSAPSSVASDSSAFLNPVCPFMYILNCDNFSNVNPDYMTSGLPVTRLVRCGWNGASNVFSDTELHIILLPLQWRLQYPATDYPQSSMNQKMIKRPITLHNSINWQNLAPIQRVWPLLMCALMIPCMCACAYTHTHTM